MNQQILDLVAEIMLIAININNKHFDSIYLNLNSNNLLTIDTYINYDNLEYEIDLTLDTAIEQLNNCLAEINKLKGES